MILVIVPLLFLAMLLQDAELTARLLILFPVVLIARFCAIRIFDAFSGRKFSDEASLRTIKAKGSK
jgi:hypothetical protein